MILWYALGGGLGHLVRMRAAAHTLGMDEVTVLTASPYASDRRVVGSFDIVQVPRGLASAPADFAAFLRDVIVRVAPKQIAIDAFPAGILGELPGVLNDFDIPLLHVARLLNLETYPHLKGSLPYRFTTTCVVELLLPEHETFLREHSDRYNHLTLVDPPSALHDVMRALIEGHAEGHPLWLVLHSGPGEEIAELLDYARGVAAAEGADPAFVLVTPGSLDISDADVLHVDLHPATPLFPLADRIITACGFNAMRQTEPFRERHRFIPFPRRYDDQFLRAARARTL